METRSEKWIRTILNCLMLAVVAVVIKDCSNKLGTRVGVTTYDGFAHICESAGGIEMNGLCVSTENLIQLDLHVEEEDR